VSKRWGSLQIEDHAFGKTSDVLRDRLLNMAKLNVIDDVGFWIDSRKIRNKIAHTYITAELKDLYKEIFKRAKIVFKTFERIEKYLKK
jgi:uncharacterized protein with HEPN domain